MGKKRLKEVDVVALESVPAKMRQAFELMEILGGELRQTARIVNRGEATLWRWKQTDRWKMAALQVHAEAMQANSRRLRDIVGRSLTIVQRGLADQTSRPPSEEQLEVALKVLSRPHLMAAAHGAPFGTVRTEVTHKDDESRPTIVLEFVKASGSRVESGDEHEKVIDTTATVIE